MNLRNFLESYVRKNQLINLNIKRNVSFVNLTTIDRDDLLYKENPWSKYLEHRILEIAGPNMPEDFSIQVFIC